MTLPVFKVGDRLNHEGESVFGIITNVLRNQSGEQSAVVVKCHDGTFATFDLSKLTGVDILVMQ